VINKDDDNNNNIIAYQNMTSENQHYPPQTNTTLHKPTLPSTNGIVPKKLHEILKLYNLLPALYIVTQKAVIHNMPYG
jgi:hypothetical protein